MLFTYEKLYLTLIPQPGIVKNVFTSSQTGAITAVCVEFVSQRWTTIVLGLTTVLVSPTTSFSYSFWDMHLPIASSLHSRLCHILFSSGRWR